MDGVPHQPPAGSSHSPLDVLRVLAEALLHLAGVGRHPDPHVLGVLLHHGLQLLAVLGHLLAGLAHVIAQLVGQLLQVPAQVLCRVLSEGRQLGLQVVLVHGQLGNAVLDQGAGGGGNQRGLRTNKGEIRNKAEALFVLSPLVFRNLRIFTEEERLNSGLD